METVFSIIFLVVGVSFLISIIRGPERGAPASIFLGLALILTSLFLFLGMDWKSYPIIWIYFFSIILLDYSKRILLKNNETFVISASSLITLVVGVMLFSLASILFMQEVKIL